MIDVECGHVPIGTHPSQSDLPLPATRFPGREPQFLSLGPGWPPPPGPPLGTDLPGCNPQPIPVIMTLPNRREGRRKREREGALLMPVAVENTDV